MSFELINVGSGRLATDGECIYDAFVKVNQNFTNIFAVTGITQNVITVNVNNTLIITQQIQIQNTSNITMVALNIDIDNNFIIDINFSVTMNIAVNFNINVDNSVNIDINSGDTTVNITAVDVDINTTNTIIDNSETLNVITDNSTNSYTWVFQQDGNLRLPNGGTIIDFSGAEFATNITTIHNSFSVQQFANSGNGALTYTGGVISYTPPILQITQNSPSGNGDITQTGPMAFTYTPPADAFRIGDIFLGDYTVNVNTQIQGPTLVGGGDLVGGGITITATDASNNAQGGSVTISAGTGATDGNITLNANTGTFSVTGAIDFASEFTIAINGDIDIGGGAITVDGLATAGITIDENNLVTIGAGPAISVHASATNVIDINASGLLSLGGSAMSIAESAVTAIEVATNGDLTLGGGDSMTISAEATVNVFDVDSSSNLSLGGVDAITVAATATNAMSIDAASVISFNNALTIDASQNISIDNSSTVNFGASAVNYNTSSINFNTSTVSNFDFNYISEVNITSPANNNVLAYNNSAGEWQGIALAPQVYTGGADLVLDGGAP
tara:strand:+ start:3191 stop:4873 length:1683 start_codon:yes stop_codon:yes gene_type:complete